MTATIGAGSAASPEGGDVDFDALREHRRARLRAAMHDAGIDVLLLGRPANIRYASGARQLWTAGARSFGPGCVVMAATGRVHLLSTWDEGVPAEIAHDELFGLAWNAANLVARLAAVPGLREARRVGTDGLGPGTAELVASLAPGAELVDGGPALRAARRIKGPEEVVCIRTAAVLAEAALDAMASAVAPGVTERALVGVHSRRLAELGAPTPASEAVACATPRRGPARLRRMTSDRTLAAGELVALSAGALWAGYEADVARAVTCPHAAGGSSEPAGPQAAFVARLAEAHAATVAACRPGATGSDLLGAWRAAGGMSGGEPLAWGLGLGVEAPLVGDGCGSEEQIEEGMVLAVQGWMTEEGVGGALRTDTIVVGPEGPEVITRA